uniref:GDSL esterase/lipase At3g26430-like n=1 Tax=Tanacetum cinerariifolium TaxID=118510 RepID=A0A6L2LC22_TANCI|nr:GDSL esterase/lipase At3g26430-like [Tanacetum cinerariifolium]
MELRCQVVILLIMFLSYHVVDASKNLCDFPAIFNFGDSNSDTGGLSAAFGQAGPPHGESFFHGPAGRYCDGRLVIDFIGPFGCLPYVMDRQLVTAGQVDKYGCVGSFNELAQFFNHRLKETVDRLREELPKAAITYVDIYSVKYALITQATRYGFMHPLRACCGHGGKYNYNIHVGCGGKVKVNDDEVFKKLMPKTKDFRHALYTFDIGQNDLTAGLFQNLTVDEVRANVPDIVGQFKDVIKSVYDQGGRSVNNSFDNHPTQRKAQQENELSNLTRQRQLLSIVNYRRAIIEELERLPRNLMACKTTEHLKRIQKAVFVEVIDLKKELRLQVPP